MGERKADSDVRASSRTRRRDKSRKTPTEPEPVEGEDATPLPPPPRPVVKYMLKVHEFAMRCGGRPDEIEVFASSAGTVAGMRDAFLTSGVDWDDEELVGTISDEFLDLAQPKFARLPFLRVMFALMKALGTSSAGSATAEGVNSGIVHSLSRNIIQRGFFNLHNALMDRDRSRIIAHSVAVATGEEPSEEEMKKEKDSTSVEKSDSWIESAYEKIRELSKEIESKRSEWETNTNKITEFNREMIVTQKGTQKDLKRSTKVMHKEFHRREELLRKRNGVLTDVEKFAEDILRVGYATKMKTKRCCKCCCRGNVGKRRCIYVFQFLVMVAMIGYATIKLMDG